MREKVLALVTEKTGYPPDMLDLDLDLEADLGVDTVKQAELFASVRQEWDIPRDEKRKLRDYPTLRHVVAFVHAMRPDLKVVAAAETPAAATSTTRRGHPGAGRQERTPCATPSSRLVTEKTGYPPDMLDLDLDLEADLGVDTVKQAELFASVRGRWDIPRDEKRKLRDYPTLRHVVDFVYQMRPDLRAAPCASPAEAATPAIPAAAATTSVVSRPRRPRRGRPRPTARGCHGRAPAPLALQAHRRQPGAGEPRRGDGRPRRGGPDTGPRAREARV